jgi:predicted RNA-binding protein YlqC (UPF0109 family)
LRSCLARSSRAGSTSAFPEGVLTAEGPEELVEYLARRLVDRPDDVRVERDERDGATVILLHVHEEDRGKVIGRGGRIVRALRTLVRASGARRDERTLLEIAE